jgi:hypothetical protein
MGICMSKRADDDDDEPRALVPLGSSSSSSECTPDLGQLGVDGAMCKAFPRRNDAECFGLVDTVEGLNAKLGQRPQVRDNDFWMMHMEHYRKCAPRAEMVEVCVLGMAKWAAEARLQTRRSWRAKPF